MLNLIDVTIQNFKSFGNKKITIPLNDHQGLTMILGENEDSADTNARNGCGKSTIFDAIAYALTGSPIKKAKPPSSIINRVNQKKMQVTLRFELGMYECLIERGMKPAKCNFYKKLKSAKGDIKDAEFDCTRDSVANTTNFIIKFTRIDNDICKHVLISSAKTTNFFDMDAENQRKVIEMLFAFTLLSQKAKALKDMRTKRETDLATEKARVEERLGFYERNLAKLKSLNERSATWEETHKTRLDELNETIEGLEVIDFDDQQRILEAIADHNRQIEDYKRAVSDAERLIANQQRTIDGIETKLANAKSDVTRLKDLDFEAYLEELAVYEEATNEIKQKKVDLKQELASVTKDFSLLYNQIKAKKNEIEAITETCPTCGQGWPDKDARTAKVSALKDELAVLVDEQDELNKAIEGLQFDLGELNANDYVKPTQFPNRDAAIRASSDLDNARSLVKTLGNELSEAEDQKDELGTAKASAEKALCAFEESSASTKGEDLVFESISELASVRTTLEQSIKQRDQLKTEANPYLEDIAELEKVTQEQADSSGVIEIEKDIERHTKLMKLMTSRDSGIRKKITASKLPSLNSFIIKYLEALDLPYIVRFNDDLTPSIFDFEEEGVFSGLSSGEEERVGIALSWAFRDLFEDMNYPINFYAIDERIDAGMDESGAERAIAVLYEMAVERKRNVFLVSHRNELKDYATRTMTVTKKNRFSSIDIAA